MSRPKPAVPKKYLQLAAEPDVYDRLNALRMKLYENGTAPTIPSFTAVVYAAVMEKLAKEGV